MTCLSALARWEKLHGAPVAAIARYLESADPAALEELRSPRRSSYELWPLEDLLEAAPDPPRWDLPERRLLGVLAALERRGGHASETPLMLLARWLERRLRREPAEADWFAIVREALALPPETILELAWRTAPVAGQLSSAGRYLLAQPLAALEPILRAARGHYHAPLPPLIGLFARHAPARLVEVARFVHGLYDPAAAGALLQLLLAMPEPTCWETAAELAGAAPPRELLAGLTARLPGRFAITLSAEAVLGDLQRRRQLAPESLASITRYLERGDRSELERLPRFTSPRSPYATTPVDDLVESLPLPDGLEEPHRRVLDLLIQLGAEIGLCRWVERAVAIERPGEDALGLALAELEGRGLDSAACFELLGARATRFRGPHGLSSIGRWLLALGDLELQAYGARQRATRVGVGVGFLLEEAPERFLELQRSRPAPHWLRDLHQLPALSAMLDRRPELFEPLLLRAAEDPASLFSEEERAQRYTRHQIDGLAFDLWKLLFRHDRARFATPACTCARAIALAADHPRRVEAIHWLIRSLGGEALEEALQRIAAAPTEHDAYSISFFLAGVFGPHARRALDWLFARPEAYHRICTLQLLIGFRDPELDGLIDAQLEALLGGADLHGQASAVGLCELWGFARKQERLWGLLESKAKQVRARVAHSLAKHGDPESFERVLPLLSHKQAGARLGAVELLRSLDLERAAPLLEARLENESSEEVRDELLLALKEVWRAQRRKIGWEEIERRIARTRLRSDLAPWLALEELPPLYLTGSETPLPARAVHYLLHRQSRVRGVREDLEAEALYALVDRRSSGDFALALLEGFLGAGGATEESWALTVAGLLGDERVVPRLVVATRDWIKDRRLGFAEYAVRALALQGSDAALLALDGLALRHAARPKNVGEAASEAFAEAAERQDLTQDALRDRVVPWLGFESGKPRLVDCGGRSIEVRISDALSLALRDAKTGKAVRSLPESAPAEVALELKELKGLLRGAASAQSLRLENLLVVGHRWSGAVFRERFLGHPLLRPFARRLVFGRYHASGALQASFRAGTDLRLEDVGGAEVELTGDAMVGLVHPLELAPDALEAWRARLAQEPAPPFAQLERQVHRVAPDERELDAYCRLRGVVADTRLIKRTTERLGWRRGDTSGGWINDYYKAFPLADVVARIGLEEMPVVLELSGSARFGELRFAPRDAPARRLRLGEVAEIVYSETISDLHRISGQPSE